MALFDDDKHVDQNKEIRKEDTSLEKLKGLEDKITIAVEKVKALKEENMTLQKRIRELEELLNEKSVEIEQLRSEKSVIRGQIESLINELDLVETE